MFGPRPIEFLDSRDKICFLAPQHVKEAACKRLVLPIIEYGGSCNGLNGKLENVQKRAAKFMMRNYSRETGSMTGIFEELKWEILKLEKEEG